jgi:hypothetical protein
VSGAASWLISAGSDLVSGLIHGIEGAIGRAVDTVKRAMHDVVSGAESALGIGSPSKVFAVLGDQTVAGYVAGVTRSAAAAVAAVAAVLTPPGAGAVPAGAGGASSSAAVAGSAIGLSGDTGGYYVNEIHIHVGDEVVRVVRQVVDDGNRDLRRRVQAGTGSTL